MPRVVFSPECTAAEPTTALGVTTATTTTTAVCQQQAEADRGQQRRVSEVIREGNLDIGAK